MPRLFPHLYAVEATPAQYEKATGYARELLKRARDLTKELDLPVSEFRHVLNQLDQQVGLLVTSDEEARMTRRLNAVNDLRVKLGTADDVQIGDYIPMAPQPNLGHHPLGYPNGGRPRRVPVHNVMDDGFDRMTDQQLNELLKANGIDPI
jgi:hypothetical protein